MNLKSIILNAIFGIIFLFVIILLIAFNPYINHFVVYYSNFKITIPMPKEKNIIYSSNGIDHFNFEIWDYGDSQINKLKKKDYLKEITKENKDIVNQYYIDNSIYFNDIEIEKNFNVNEIITEGNYYAFIYNSAEIGEDFSYNISLCDKYILLFLDINTHKVYMFRVVS